MIQVEPRDRSKVGRKHSAKARCPKGSGIKAGMGTASRVKESFMAGLVLRGSGTTIVLGTTATLIIAILLSMARGEQTYMYHM
jgi:hypothetical protein